MTDENLTKYKPGWMNCKPTLTISNDDLWVSNNIKLLTVDSSNILLWRGDAAPDFTGCVDMYWQCTVACDHMCALCTGDPLTSMYNSALYTCTHTHDPWLCVRMCVWPSGDHCLCVHMCDCTHSWYTGDPLVTGKLVLSWAVEGGGAGDLDDDGKVVSAAAARHAHIHAPSLTHSLSSLFLFLDPLSRGWCNEDTHQVLVLALGRVNIMLTLSGLKYSAVFMRSRFWFSSLAPRHSRVNAIGQDIDLLN